MMRIGEVARQGGLRTSAIRYYERLGLLPVPQRTGGRRHYGPEVLSRLQVIRFARSSGFSLREVRSLLGGRPYSGQMRRLARAKILELEGAIERAHAMRSLLQSALRCKCLTAEECGRRLLRADGVRYAPASLEPIRPPRR